MQTRACLPAALGALHNFICVNDPDEMAALEDDDDDYMHDREQPHIGELANGVPDRAERARAGERQQTIAKAM